MQHLAALPQADRIDELGFDPERLNRVGAALTADFKRGEIPGAVVAIARGGRIAYAKAVGYRDPVGRATLLLDSIFRIASMTKPIVSITALHLAEEGKLELAAPVAHYLPEFSGMTIGPERAASTRLMTVHDLLRHTSGLTYATFGDSDVHMLWREAGLLSETQTNGELISALARLPLMSEPGTTWEYSMSTDVLGRVIEVVTGSRLGEAIDTRVCRPLGMVDTSFFAIGDKALRVAEPLVNPVTGQKPQMRDVTRDSAWQSGGGGLVSTAADYVRFCQMLLQGGVLDGACVVSPHTVALFAADHLPPNIGYGANTRALFGALAPVPEMGYGFGLGVAVRKAAGLSPLPGSVGEFSWGGSTGTYFWIDPHEQLVVVLMMQAPEKRLTYRFLLRRLVYSALVRPLPPSHALSPFYSR